MACRRLSLRSWRHDHAAVLCAFDVIELDGKDLRWLPIVEKWSRDGLRVELMLYARNNLDRARRIFDRAVKQKDYYRARTELRFIRARLWYPMMSRRTKSRPASKMGIDGDLA
jgi:hypothetical protein